MPRVTWCEPRIGGEHIDGYGTIYDRETIRSYHSARTTRKQELYRPNSYRSATPASWQSHEWSKQNTLSLTLVEQSTPPQSLTNIA